MKKIHIVVLLFFIIILATALRIWNISTNPAGFFVDEASQGLEAYSLLTIGTDTHGNPFPIIFKAVGDYRDPVMIYSAMPFIYIFGLNEFAVRITSAFYGILAVIMMYIVGREYFNQRIGLWSAFLLAISPWHVHFSRVGFQLIASVFWLLVVLYFLHKSFKNQYYFIPAVVSILITFFTYSTTKMYLPFLIIFHMFSYPLNWLQLVKKKFILFVIGITLIVGTIIVTPLLQNGTFFQRWMQVDQHYSLKEIATSYSNHFSTDFLFMTGDAEFPNQQVKRHSIHGVGELYWFQLLFLFVSVAIFIISKKERMKLIFWVLFLYIYPLGTIFTSLEPQATRSILGVIPFTLITAYGIDQIPRLFKTEILKKLYYGAFGSVLFLSLFLFTVALKNYPYSGADYWGWQYGYRESVQYVSQFQKEYEDILITHRFNMGMELLSFYNKIYPCNNCATAHNPIEINDQKKQLFVLRPEDIKEATNLYPHLLFHKKKDITLPNGNIELYIGEFAPITSSF